MAETWVRPPLLGQEAPPAWIALWRFRVLMLLLLVVLVALLVVLYRQLSGANAQDPGIADTPGSPASAPRVPGLTVPAAAP